MNAKKLALLFALSSLVAVPLIMRLLKPSKNGELSEDERFDINQYMVSQGL